MRFGHSYPPPGLVRWSRTRTVLSSSGALVDVHHKEYSYVNLADANDGDRHILDFFCDGSETKLMLGTLKDTVCGKFDLYVNGVLDSSAYDDYAAASTESQRVITLTVPVVAGRNVFELVINGKNVASTDYALRVYGASLQ